MTQQRCSHPNGITIKPDGVHELNPCRYQEIEKYINVTATVAQCRVCGHITVSWERQEDTEELWVCHIN